MNEPSVLTDEQLRLATSRLLPPGAALEADAAASRGAFLSLGSALATAGDAFDEEALIARLQQECVVQNSAAAVSAAVVPRSSRQSWWPLVVGGVLAATVLVVVFRLNTGLRLRNEGVVKSGGQPTITASGKNRDASESEAEQAQPGGNGSTLALSNGWSDPLDDQIAYVAASIGELSGASRGLDGSLWDMNDRLEALSQELLSESL